MAEPLLTIKNLSAWYDPKKKVLSEVSLELSDHEAVGLIGMNGAGKTTVLKVVSGLLPGFSAEQILALGKPCSLRGREFKRWRYTVFAEDRSFSYFTFREYLSYVFSAYGKALPDVTELIRGFHFEAYADVLMKELSTGSRKKAYLITGFALKPKLLLLDEPVNGLDYQSTEYLYQLIRGYREHGTVLFASHILESLTQTSDRVLVLEHGTIRRTFEGGRIDAAGIREALNNDMDV